MTTLTTALSLLIAGVGLLALTDNTFWKGLGAAAFMVGFTVGALDLMRRNIDRGG